MAIAAARNVRTREFNDRFAKLPASIRELATAAFETFRRNPSDPSLSNHPLDDIRRGRHRKGSRAVSITRRYRAIYVVEGDANIWYWIGSHEDYNVFAGRK